MSRHVYSLLFSLVIFSVASTPLAWVTCPYVNGAHRCPEDVLAENNQSESEQSHCSKKKSHTPKQVVRIDPKIALPAITRQGEQCSHCIMHSRSEANAPSRVAIVNSSSDYSIAPAMLVVVFSHQRSNRPLVDVHQHGPPGSQDHRYIVNSTFRI